MQFQLDTKPVQHAISKSVFIDRSTSGLHGLRSHSLTDLGRFYKFVLDKTKTFVFWLLVNLLYRDISTSLSVIAHPKAV